MVLFKTDNRGFKTAFEKLFYMQNENDIHIQKQQKQNK